jgi:excisionase family DNA binding protein
MAPPDTTPPAKRRTRWQAPTRTRLTPVKRSAAENGIPYTTMRDVIHRGEIPVIKIGRAQYVETSDVDHWITSRKETA